MQTAEAHSERVTFLTSPSFKKRLMKLARANDLTVGEYVGRKVADADVLSKEEEEELVFWTEQVNDAIPKMEAAFDRMIERLQKTNAETDAFLREKGIRK